jgi:hypothetical protein
VVAIAQKVTTEPGTVLKLLAEAGLPKVELEITKAEYGSGGSQKDVTEILRKHVSDSQLISLPSNNYNELFGGDPAPGAPKQLKIQYKLNGKPAEAALTENALVILALPK